MLKKLRDHSIKSGGDLEKVGNRMAAIASMNTCKHQLENCNKKINFLGKFNPHISYSVWFTFAYSNC